MTTVKPMQKISLRMHYLLVRLLTDRSGLAAVEFAIMIPLMMALFFGTVEFSNGVAIDRKVTLVARTLSDLTSQSTSATNTDFTNFTITAKAIMTPYSSTPLISTVSELYIDPTSLAARVQWSKGSSPRAVSSTVSVPAALKVAGTYLIYSEVSYNYVPAVGYVMMSSGINLSDHTFTRPRQSLCVMYGTTLCTTL